MFAKIIVILIQSTVQPLPPTVFIIKCTEEGKAQIGHLLNSFSVIVAGWERSCKTVRVETGGVSVTGDDTD